MKDQDLIKVNDTEKTNHRKSVDRFRRGSLIIEIEMYDIESEKNNKIRGNII